MANCRSGLVFFVLLLHASLSVLPVLSDHRSDIDQEEKNLLNGLNNYRRNHNLPSLSEVDGADCLADKIATQFQDSASCFILPSDGSYSISADPGSSIPGYYRFLRDCDLDVDDTKDGVILPACVGDITGDLTYVIANFTETGYARYLRDSDYTGGGVGSEGVWVVVVLTTDSEGGDFSGGRSLGVGVGVAGLVVVNWVVFCLIM